MPPEKETVESIKRSASAPFGLFPYFILCAGCRRGEALAMRWSDIDFESNLVYVRQNIVFMNNKAAVNGHPKTKAGIHSIPLLPSLRTVLQAQPKEAAYIFANERRLPLSETQYNHRLSAYKKRPARSLPRTSFGMNLQPCCMKRASMPALHKPL